MSGFQAGSDHHDDVVDVDVEDNDHDVEDDDIDIDDEDDEDDGYDQTTKMPPVL